MNTANRTLLALLLAFAMPAVGQEPGMAVIVTGVAQPVSCISAVAIRKIDGLEVQVDPQRFELAPGEHTMTGRAQLDMRYCLPGEDRAADGSAQSGYLPLEGYFEAGKQYYVGFDHSAAERGDWQLTVWKIEDVAADQ